MAQRTVCLCNGKYIGIETIYTVINGQQINIPEKIKALRAKSQNNELFCPCGCGANLILVAGDRNLREQHFRLKDGTFYNECRMTTEGRISIDSKIVLKCWLDENLDTEDIEARVPIKLVGDIDRKYEFTFLSRARNIALSYCRERVHLSDEKFEILKANSQGIHLIYVVDCINGGCNGQYPEGLMKVQERQGYCLLLDVRDIAYSEAWMSAVFYQQDIDGFWQEIEITEGRLCDYSIEDDGRVLYKSKALDLLKKEAQNDFENAMQDERIWREEEEKRREEEEKRREEEWQREQQRILEEEERRKQEQLKRREEAERKRRQQIEEQKRKEEEFKRNLEIYLSQQEKQVRDAEGNRWVKCEFCGKIATESEFNVYGGANHVNLGTCKECSDKGITDRLVEVQNSGRGNQPVQNSGIGNQSVQVKQDASVCPECGGTLREKSGRYGKFRGCGNYPRCRFTRNV